MLELECYIKHLDVQGPLTVRSFFSGSALLGESCSWNGGCLTENAECLPVDISARDMEAFVCQCGYEHKQMEDRCLPGKTRTNKWYACSL